MKLGPSVSDGPRQPSDQVLASRNSFLMHLHSCMVRLQAAHAGLGYADMPAMRVASLFSGAGGLDLGLQQAGHTIVFQCESDPAARQARACTQPSLTAEMFSPLRMRRSVSA